MSLQDRAEEGATMSSQAGDPGVGRLSVAVEGGAIIRPLISERRLRRRVRELAGWVDSGPTMGELVVLGLLDGALPFVADLIRAIRTPLRVEWAGVSSYREGMVSGPLEWTRPLPLTLAGCDVLLVDDISDTGRTLATVQAGIRALGVARLRTVVLLDKPSRRLQSGVVLDGVGFVIPDCFVVGYGLDWGGRYRQLPYVGAVLSAMDVAVEGTDGAGVVQGCAPRARRGHLFRE
jgi:hypoxanthine phosphoribosyltransferase